MRISQAGFLSSRAAAAELAAVMALATTAGARQTSGADATLTISGDVTQPVTLTVNDLRGMARTKVTVEDEGRQVTYEGVLVGDLLKRAGVPLGPSLTGSAVATYVLMTARDGYQVVFSLPELDPEFTSNDIIVADTIDGRPLFAYQGPLRIVAPHDKKGARSIRMLQTLQVVRLRKHR
jgi:hypothetical protein